MDSSRPKVSVVITSYNTARFVRAAIDSVLAQNYKALELIVVDDGSTDGSVEILEGYGASIKLIQQKNMGCAAARNTGLEAASGEVFVILDSDDLLTPGAISAKVEWLAKAPNVGLVTSRTRYIDENGDAIPGAVDLKPPYTNGVSYREAMHRIPGPISGWAIPRYVMEEMNYFDASLRAVEDYDLCLRILARYKCLCDPEVRVLYREVPGSLSRDYTHNYDHVRKVIKKNSMLAPIGNAAYWWNAKIMMLTSCAGVFTRILRESGKQGPKRLFNFLRKRPSALPYFFAWVARAFYNRMIFLFKRGPLREKELALRRTDAG